MCVCVYMYIGPDVSKMVRTSVRFERVQVHEIYLYICIYIFTYTYIYIYIYICIYIYVYIYNNNINIFHHRAHRGARRVQDGAHLGQLRARSGTPLYTYIYIYIYIYTFTYTHTHIYIQYIHICIYIYVYIHLHIYSYVYICMFIFVYVVYTCTMLLCHPRAPTPPRAALPRKSQQYMQICTHIDSVYMYISSCPIQL